MRLPDPFDFLRAKDTLRKIRYTMRREAGLIDRTLNVIGSELGARTFPLRLLPQKPVLQLSDAVFGSLEKAAKAAFQELGERCILSAPLKPITSLLRDSALNHEARGSSDFVSVLYRYSRYLLRGLPVENFYVSEHAIESARQTLHARHKSLIAEAASWDRKGGALPDEAVDLHVRLCAALACELNAARPIRRVDIAEAMNAPAQQIVESPNLFCFAAIGLAAAVASTRPAAVTLSATGVLDSSGLVTHARFSQFSAAMGSSDPALRLAAEFTKVLPVLP